jgi:NAD(P)H-flavin reductase/ferredoxin
MSDYQINLTTRDGQEVSFNCPAGSDIISAGAHADILLPALCKDGGCGACLGHCDQGEYTLGSHSPNMLSAAEAAQGHVLLCRTFPESDLQLSAPYDYAQIQFGKQSARQAVITGLELVAERTMRLKLNWLDAMDKAVEFEPGQCMELEIPGGEVRRAYSLANTGNWRGELEFLIRIQPGGQFSGFLSQQAEIGQVLNVYGPSGGFCLQPNSFNPTILVAGGAGLAPFLSMLRRLAEWGEDRPILLLFGVNQESELVYPEELQALQTKLPSLSVTLCVWRPSPDWTGFNGTPAEALQAYLTENPGEYDVYLCGPPLMVSSVMDTALAAGISEQRIFSEKFG